MRGLHMCELEGGGHMRGHHVGLVTIVPCCMAGRRLG